MPSFTERLKRWESFSSPMRSMLDEYARAIVDLERVVAPMTDAQYTASTPLSNDTFPTLKVMMEHVIGASHSYTNYIEDALEGVDRGRRQPAFDFATPATAMTSLWSSFDHMIDVLDAASDFNEDQIFKLSFTARWGEHFNLEQILEHAICHILRHRRQVEHWLNAM